MSFARRRLAALQPAARLLRSPDAGRVWSGGRAKAVLPEKAGGGGEG